MGSGGVGTSCSRTAEKHVHTCGMVWKQVQTGGNKSKRVETTIRMGTGKVGNPCSRTPEKHVFRPRKRPEIPTEPAGKTVSSGTPEIPRTPGRGDFPSVY